MMLRTMMSRGRKRMMLRRMMLRYAEEGVEDDDTEDADVQEEEDRSQDRAAWLVRACAVEMHLDMSQEPFYAEIFR